MAVRKSISILSSLILAVSLSAGGSSVALASSMDPSSGAAAADESMVNAFSEEMNISVDDAGRVLQEQDRFNEIITNLGEQFSESEYDSWIEHDPAGASFYVRTVNDGVIDAFSGVEDLDITLLQEQPLAPPSIALVKEKASELQEAIPNLNLISVAQQNGEIALEVHAGGSDAISAKSSNSNEGEAEGLARRILGQGADSIPVSVQAVEEEAGDANRAGLRMSGDEGTCTTGFTAIGNTYKNGFLTAAHCGRDNPNLGYYHNGSSVKQPSTRRAVNHGVDADIEFRSVNERTYGTYWTGSAHVSVKGTKSASVGTYLCHFGRTMQRQCGVVANINASPSWEDACLGSTCNPSFVVVQAYQDGGDSGGPWYAGGYAYGIHKGGSSTYSVYSKIQYRPSGASLPLKTQ